MRSRITAAIAGLAVIAALALTGCTSSEYDQRRDDQNSVTLDNSLGISNQEERLEREEDPNAIRYVYLMSKTAGAESPIVGYYVIKGKVSPAGTQLAPEQEIICRSTAESCQAVDSAKDDGTYGASDEGSFFFTSDGVLVETTLDYIQSDAPLAIDVPRLSE